MKLNSASGEWFVAAKRSFAISRAIALPLLIHLSTCLFSAQMTGVITTVKGEVQVLPYQKNTWQP